MINVPQSMELAFNEMRANAMSEAVKLLAEKYGFDATEASLSLNLASLNISEAKVVAKKPVVALTEEEKAAKAVIKAANKAAKVATKEADKTTKAATKAAKAVTKEADKAATKAAKVATKEAKVATKEADKATKPKRAASGYQLYCKSVRDEQLGSTSVTEKGPKWSALNQEDKDMWNAKAVTANMEYESNYEE